MKSRPVVTERLSFPFQGRNAQEDGHRPNSTPQVPAGLTISETSHVAGSFSVRLVRFSAAYPAPHQLAKQRS
jgi:hypothetical protein